MAKIYLQGQTEPISVSEEEARDILELKNDSKNKGVIQIGNVAVSKGKVGKIVFGDGLKDKRFNLNDPQDKAKILEFEMILDSLKDSMQMSHPIEYYGSPLNQDKLPGMVLNQMLGGVHWTAVQYALDNQLIGRRGTDLVYWSILTPTRNFNDPGISPDLSEFCEFEAKLKALADLKSRRSYAQKMNTQSLESLDNLKESLMESTAMPTPADNGNDSEQL